MRYLSVLQRTQAVESSMLKATSSYVSSSSTYPQNRSATTIQKVVRGHQARASFLPQSLFAAYRPLCHPSHALKMPRATTGKTPVFLPKQLPQIVLKRTGHKKAVERFAQMQAVRKIVHRENCTHIDIPSARLCGDMLVEQRLPINDDIGQQLKLYLCDTALFDAPVREMTRLFPQAFISGLLYPDKSGEAIYLVRYDNLPWYVTDNNGVRQVRIALSDLERVKINYTVRDNDYKLGILTYIFPLHVEIIIAEAHRSQLKIDEVVLRDAAKEGLQHLSSWTGMKLSLPARPAVPMVQIKDRTDSPAVDIALTLVVGVLSFFLKGLMRLLTPRASAAQ